eukprot:COSAG02_NODE_40872_length_400_cov_1.169435_1_plen_26_part_01
MNDLLASIADHPAAGVRASACPLIVI